MKAPAQAFLRLALAAALCSSVGSVWAYEAEVDASLEAQYYTFESPWGDPQVRRRRYTETLGLSVWNIQGAESPRGPRLNFQSRLRVDADFGQSSAERRISSTRYVPGLEEAPLDLMYAYLEGQRYWDGRLGFRLGRQYVIDVLGFWSFDGALLTLSTPIGMVFEVFAGFEQRGGGVPGLGTRRFEAQGVYRGDRYGLERNQWPMFLEESALAPAAGFAVEAEGFGVVRSRLAYRKVINRDSVNVSPFVDAGGGQYELSGDRTSSERLGHSLRAESLHLGALTASAAYDFYTQTLYEYAGALDAYVTPALTAGVSFDRYTPTFDGDSIFNWFSHSPTTSALGRAELRLGRRFELGAMGGVRWFETEGAPGDYERLDFGQRPDRTVVERLFDLTFDAGVTYAIGPGSIALRGGGETGERGHRLGADVTGRRAFGGGRFDGLLVLSLWDWSDALRPDRDALSFGYVVGAGYHPGPSLVGRTRLGVELEHNMNRLVGHRFRALATLDVTVFE